MGHLGMLTVDDAVVVEVYRRMDCPVAWTFCEMIPFSLLTVLLRYCL